MVYRFSKRAVILVAFGLMSAVVHAEEERPGEIGLVLGAAAADKDVTGEATQDFTLGVRGGYHLNSNWTWFGEGLYSRFDSTSPTVDPMSINSPALVPSDEEVETLSVRTGLQYLFSSDRSWNWFFSFGAGWMDVVRSDLLLKSDGMGGVSGELVSGDFNRLLASVGQASKPALPQIVEFGVLNVLTERWIGEDVIYGLIGDGQVRR